MRIRSTGLLAITVCSGCHRDPSERIADLVADARPLLGHRAHAELAGRLYEGVGSAGFDEQLAAVERAVGDLADAASAGENGWLSRRADGVELAVAARYGDGSSLCDGPSFAYGRGVEISVGADAYAAAIAGAGVSYAQAAGAESTFDLRARRRAETAIAGCGAELGPRFGVGAETGGSIGVGGYSTLIVNYDPSRYQPLAVGVGIKASLEIEEVIGIEIGVDAAYWYAASTDDCALIANPVECALFSDEPADPGSTWGLMVGVEGALSGGGAGLVGGIGAATSASCTFDPPLAEHRYDAIPGGLGAFAAAIEMSADIVGGTVDGVSAAAGSDPFAPIAAALAMTYVTACSGSRLALAGSKVQMIDDDGSVRWTIDTNEGATGVFWPDADYRAVAAIYADLTGDGIREVVIAADHATWFPAQLLSVSADTGAVVGRYWHPGHLRAIAAVQHPIRAVVAAGGNNDLDAATVAILRYGVSGQAPPYRGKVSAATHVGYAVLPEPGQNGANFAEEVQIVDDRIVVRGPGWEHVVDFQGRLVK